MLGPQVRVIGSEYILYGRAGRNNNFRERKERWKQTKCPINFIPVHVFLSTQTVARARGDDVR